MRLDSVATFSENLGSRRDRSLRPAVRGNLLRHADHPLGEAVAKLRQHSADLPPGYQVKLIGQAEEFGKTTQYMVFAFVLAMILLYMVLASQFDSFLQPFIVMLAQPWPSSAAWRPSGHRPDPQHLLDDRLGSAHRPGGQEFDPARGPHQPAPGDGMGIDEALANACPIRMRPVLMTSATVILASPRRPRASGPGQKPTSPFDRGDRRHDLVHPPHPGGGTRRLFLVEHRLAHHRPALPMDKLP